MRIASALLVLFAAPSAPVVYDVVPAQSVLKYTVKHKLHEVSAEAHEMEGKAILRPDGAAQVMVRARVAAFLSGDGNRDEHMQETMEAARFPYVVFKGVGKLAPPARYPATAQVTLDGELDFHGQKKLERVPLTLDLRSPTEVHVSGTIDVSLEAYKVERPSLLLVPIDDTCEVKFDLDLVAK